MVYWWRYSLTVFLEILSSVKKKGFQRQYFLQILLSKNTVVTVFPFGIVFIWIILNISNIFVRLFVPYSWTSIPKLFGRPFQKKQTSIPQKFWKSIHQKPSKQSTTPVTSFILGPPRRVMVPSTPEELWFPFFLGEISIAMVHAWVRACKWVSEWVSEWLSEWVSECVCACVCPCRVQLKLCQT